MKMKIKLRSIELAWHFISVTILSSAFFAAARLTELGKMDAGERDFSLQILALIGFSPSLLTIFHLRRIVKTINYSWPLFLLICLSFVSAAWSDIPMTTLQRSVAVTIASLYGILLATRYSFDTVIRLLSWMFVIVTTSSFIAVLAGADWALEIRDERMYTGIATSVEAWKGVTAGRDSLGYVTGLTTIVALTYMLFMKRNTTNKILLGCILCCSIATLVGTTYVTAIISVIIAVLYLVVLKMNMLLRGSSVLKFSLVSFILILITAVAVLFYIPVLELLGRDSTFTGRTLLWENLLNNVISRKPILGYGFGSFWQGGTIYQFVSEDFNWAGQAHNGYIHMWVELGVIGLFVFLFMLFQISGMLLKSVFSDLNNLDSRIFVITFTGSFLLFILSINTADSTFTVSNASGSGLLWVLFVYCYTLIVSERFLEEKKKEINLTVRD